MGGPGIGGLVLAVWVVMMAAMMFPSVAPTVALYSRMTGRRSLASPFAFASGYLVTWAGAGALAFALAAAGRVVAGDVLSWTTPAAGWPGRRCSSPPAYS